jgi:hypothetical protein
VPRRCYMSLAGCSPRRPRKHGPVSLKGERVACGRPQAQGFSRSTPPSPSAPSPTAWSPSSFPSFCSRRRPSPGRPAGSASRHATPRAMASRSRASRCRALRLCPRPPRARTARRSRTPATGLVPSTLGPTCANIYRQHQHLLICI